MTLTLPKLLLLAVVVWLVWTFLRRNNIIGGANRGTTAPGPERPKSQQAERAIEDMVKCPKCGSYVPSKGGHDCQKA